MMKHPKSEEEVRLAEQIKRSKELVTVPMILFLENAESDEFTRDTINQLFQEVFTYLDAHHYLEFLGILHSFIRRRVEFKNLNNLVSDVFQRANDRPGGVRQKFLKHLAAEVCNLCEDFHEASEELNRASKRLRTTIWARREAAAGKPSGAGAAAAAVKRLEVGARFRKPGWARLPPDSLPGSEAMREELESLAHGRPY